MKQWWLRRSIRFRLAVVWYGLGGVLLIGGFSAGLYFYVSVTIARPLDYELREDLAEIRQRLVVSPGGDLIWNGAVIPAGANWNSDDPWFELWDEQDRLVRRLWPFAESRMEQPTVPPARGRERFAIYNVAHDLRLRVYSVPFDGAGPSADWTIRVLTTHRPMAEALAPLRWLIYVALPVVGTLLVLGGYALTRRWLMPLDLMVAEANRITAEDLSRRLPVGNEHDELGLLATVFNVTLDRLEASFVALDQFVVNASHELRTPLTTLRSVGEVGLRRGRSVEEYREIIGSMLEEARRLELLVQRLLELASAEGATPDVHLTSFRLDEHVATCVNELGILAEQKNQRIALDTVPCAVRSDPVIFRQALQNLVDNAIKYSPEGSTIRISVGVSPAGCDVTVSDEGPGISPEHRTQLGTRFFRPDTGRGRGQGGLGLGLSLTRAYLRVLGGSLVYQSVEPHGSAFRLTLPKE